MYLSIITYIVSIIIYFFINLRLIKKIYKFKSLFIYFLFNSFFIIIEYYKLLITYNYIALKNMKIIYLFVIYFIILFIKFLSEKNRENIIYLLIISSEYFIFKILSFCVGLFLFIITIIFSPDTSFMDIFINLH